MKMARWLLSLCFLPCAMAEQAPWARPDIPISSHDRVYTADQTSNTVSVIDPAENKLLGVIRLGDPVPGALSPLYKGNFSFTVSVTRQIPRRSPSSRLGQTPSH